MAHRFCEQRQVTARPSDRIGLVHLPPIYIYPIPFDQQVIARYRDDALYHCRSTARLADDYDVASSKPLTSRPPVDRNNQVSIGKGRIHRGTTYSHNLDPAIQDSVGHQTNCQRCAARHKIA
jgi:hypothetical protein